MAEADSFDIPARGWEPRWYQKDAWDAILDPNINNVVLAWARRHGKDELAMQGTLVHAMQRKGTYYHCLPKYEQARKTLWEMINPHTGRVRWQDVFPTELIKHTDNKAMKLTLINDSVWQLVGSDSVSSLVGGAPIGIVFSEAALSDPTATAYFEPMLIENKGWSMHISSVRGKNHFYREFVRASDDSRSFASHISALDTDVYSQEVLDQARKTYVVRYGQVLGLALFNQEFYSSWDAAVVGAVWGPELEALEKTGRAKPIKYDPRYPVHTSWDIGVNDHTVVYFWQIIHRTPRMIDWFSTQGSGLQTCVEELKSRNYLYGMHIAPHDIRVRSWTADGLSRMAEAKKLGLDFTPTIAPERKKDGIAASAGLIRRMEINVQEDMVENPTDDCRHVLDMLKQYRYSYDRERNILSKQPVHDDTSHFADALQTMAIYEATEGEYRDNMGYKVQNLTSENNFNGDRLSDILARQKARKNIRGAWG